MHILQTVLYVFPWVLKRRICFIIKTFFSWWSSPLFSWPRCLIQEWYCKENSDASHHRGLKGWKSNVSHCPPPPPKKKKIVKWLHCTMHLNTNQVPSCSENLLDVTCRFFFSETLSCNRLLTMHQFRLQSVHLFLFFCPCQVYLFTPLFPKNNVVSWFHDLLATNRQHGMGNGRGDLVISLEYKANSSVTLLIKQRTD